jgi:hypothetical protein
MGEPPSPKKPIAWVEIPCEGDAHVPEGMEGVLTGENLYRTLQSNREDRWRRLVLAYEEDLTDFYCAWRWLNEHPIFYRCHRELHERSLTDDRGILDSCVEVKPVKVNPKTARISEDDTKNTKLEFWVEVFPRSIKPEHNVSLHDYLRDTGGDTYEKAIITVAKSIYDHHGNDRAVLDKEWKQ